MNKLNILGLVLLLSIFTGCVNKQNTESKLKPINKESFVEKSTIHDAVRINDLELVEYFLENGVDIDSKDKFGYTPLHLAARFNHYEIAKLLIDKGANTNTKDKYSDSPLIDSTRNGYSAMSELLLCNDAQRTITDKYGLTPYEYALRDNDIRLTKLLKMEDLQKVCKRKVKTVAPEVEYSVDKPFEGQSITLDDVKVITETTPMICGDLIDPSVLQIQISLDGGKTIFDANIDKENKRWCAEVTKPVKNGSYEVAAISINQLNKMTRVEDSFKVIIEDSLLEQLKEEFKNDFKKWSLELVEDSYILRFKNSSSMFSRGSDEVSDEYTKIFNEFFPKYLNIIKNNADIIASVSIQGHTSSRYRTAKTPEEKFEKNRALSQKRADAVLRFLQRVDTPIVRENRGFIREYFKAEGKSSSELIYNDDGSENIEASRRVEFKIEIK